jgi:hypothetical protein
MPVTRHHKNYNNGHHPSLHSIQTETQGSSSLQAQTSAVTQKHTALQHHPHNNGIRRSSYNNEVEEMRGRTSSLRSDFGADSGSLASAGTDDRQEGKDEDDCSTLNNRTSDRTRKNRMNRILESLQYNTLPIDTTKHEEDEHPSFDVSLQ